MTKGEKVTLIAPGYEGLRGRIASDKPIKEETDWWYIRLEAEGGLTLPFRESEFRVETDG